MRVRKNIVVFGLGYVGTSLSVLLAKYNNVYGIANQGDSNDQCKFSIHPCTLKT